MLNICSGGGLSLSAPSSVSYKRSIWSWSGWGSFVYVVRILSYLRPLKPLRVTLPTFARILNGRISLIGPVADKFFVSFCSVTD